MKRVLIILFFSLPLHQAFAQSDSSFLVAGKTGVDIVDFTVDNLGNIYTLDKADQLKKVTDKGDSVAVFNDVKRYGKVSSIDATNPLKVLLFYKDFGTIVVLDRFLTVRNTIDIRKLGIFQAKVIAQSYDNGVWIYDEQEAKLKKIDDDGNITGQSADLRQAMESAPSPVSMVDQDRLVYLYDTAQGLFVFDYFGTLKNKLSVLGWEDFQVIGKNIYGRKGSLFERYELNTLSFKEQELKEALSGADKIKISLSYLYCLKNGVITVYRPASLHER